MLSSSEQRIWDDIERHYAAAEADEPALAYRPPAQPPQRDAHGVDDLPVPVVASAWIVLLLVLFGAPVAGLAIGVLTALGWALWRYWPQLSGVDPMPIWPVADEPWHRSLGSPPQDGPEEGR